MAMITPPVAWAFSRDQHVLQEIMSTTETYCKQASTDMFVDESDH